MYMQLRPPEGQPEWTAEEVAVLCAQDGVSQGRGRPWCLLIEAEAVRTATAPDGATAVHVYQDGCGPSVAELYRTWPAPPVQEPTAELSYWRAWHSR